MTTAALIRHSTFDRPWVVWTGRVLSALPVLMLLLSASMKLFHAPQFASIWQDKLGWPESTLTGVGILELSCALLYAIPKTSVLGAVLVAGYLGAAVSAHVRIGDPGFTTPLLLGILAWVGLYLREPRLRELLPLRQDDGPKDAVATRRPTDPVP